MTPLWYMDYTIWNYFEYNFKDVIVHDLRHPITMAPVALGELKGTDIAK